VNRSPGGWRRELTAKGHVAHPEGKWIAESKKKTDQTGREGNAASVNGARESGYLQQRASRHGMMDGVSQFIKLA
jgi:hypothetical protein